MVIAIVLTAGTAFLLWLGEQITAKGVGNGISIIIFAGIVAAIPNAVNQLYATQIQGAGDQLFIKLAIMFLLLLVVIAVTVGVIYVQEALRKIPIQYAKRVTGRGQTTAGQQTHLPLKLNAAGVIPVIFAVSIFHYTTINRYVFRNEQCNNDHYKRLRLYETGWYDLLPRIDYCIHIFLRIHSSESGEYS